MSPLTYLTIIAASCIVTTSADYTPVCSPRTGDPYEGPTLPDLPTQYQMKIEANIVQKNYTMYMEEYYDGIGNRGAIITVNKNITTHTTYNYEYLQAAEVSYATGEAKCSVWNLTKPDGFHFPVFGYHFANGHAYINGTASILSFGKMFNETYIGEETVRGISVNHWQTCIIHGNMSFTLDYYFTIPSFDTSSLEKEIPVRAVINGTSSWHPNGFYHVYDFFEVKYTLPWYDRMFQPPLGVPCKGQVNAKEMPKFNDDFSVSVEVVDFDKKKKSSFREYYSVKTNMFALFMASFNPTTSPTYIKIVHDFNIGLSYTIEEAVGSCNVTPIDTHSEDAVSADGIHVALRKPNNFLHLDNETWIYQGSLTHGGVPSEAWITEPFNITKYNLTNVVYEIYFSLGDWSTYQEPNVTHIPVRMTMHFMFLNQTTKQMQKSSMLMNFFHYGVEAVEPWVYDVSICYTKDTQQELAFDMVGGGIYAQYVSNNTHNFYRGVHTSLADATGLPGSRIAHIDVIEGSDNNMTIYFSLLGVLRVEGNAVKKPKQEELDMAISLLEARIDSGRMNISFSYNGTMTSLPARKGTLRSEFIPKMDTDDDAGLVGVGVLLGIAMATLILGILLGGVIGIVVAKKTSLSIPYLIQE